MSWLTNTTTTDLEVPAVGVTLRAGQSWEYLGDEVINTPAIKVTKIKPASADVEPWVPPAFEPAPVPEPTDLSDPLPEAPAQPVTSEES